MAEVELGFGAGGGDVEEASFFLELNRIGGGVGVGKFAVGHPENKAGVPFQAFGLVDGGEADEVFGAVFGVAAHADFLACDGGEQADFAEEFVECVELVGVIGELVEVGQADGGVFVVFEQVIVIFAF